MIGARLGPWIIDRELGRGGMGTVFLAHRAAPVPDAPNVAAVKVLAPELAAAPGFRARFEREIDALRKLDHPNIVRLYEPGAEEGHHYYAMELIPGPSFDDVLKRDGPRHWPEVLELACQLAPALKHAHDRGVIHRDIKPANVLRAPLDSANRDGPSEAKLTDFGIASLFSSPHLTVTGGVIGTPEYLSPEQAAGKRATRRSDLYSFGVLLYTLVVGRTPFEGEPLDLLHKHRYAQFDRPIRHVPDLPHGLDEIICNLLEKSPDKRPADGAILFRQLDSLRRKLARKSDTQTVLTMPPNANTGESDGEHLAPAEGPATLMSRLMRSELERQSRGGPVQRFFHRPVVLIALFVLAVSVLVYTFWPMRPETMYQRGAALMSSSDPADWDRAWDKYLDPLERKHPNHPYQDEVAELRQRYEEKRAERLVERAARIAGPMTEAQRFFQEGLRLRQRGDEDGAQRVWAALIEAFKDVLAEQPWVRRAERERSAARAPKAAVERQWRPLREAVARARALRAENKKEEAGLIIEALRRLYRDDPVALKVLEAEWAAK
jgi:serine/threonine-protein kinase